MCNLITVQESNLTIRESTGCNLNLLSTPLRTARTDDESFSRFFSEPYKIKTDFNTNLKKTKGSKEEILGRGGGSPPTAFTGETDRPFRKCCTEMENISGCRGYLRRQRRSRSVLNHHQRN